MKRMSFLLILLAACSKEPTPPESPKKTVAVGPSFSPIAPKYYAEAAKPREVGHFWSGSGTPPKAVATLEGHEDAVDALAFTPDGKFLVSIGYGDYTLRLWDVSRGILVQTVKTENRVVSFVVTPDGSTIISADAYANLGFWPLKDGQIGEPEMLKADIGRPSEIAISPNGMLLATVSSDKIVTLWSVAERNLLRRIQTPESVMTVDFSPSGILLATGGNGNAFTLWDLVRGTATVHAVSRVMAESAVADLAFSADGKWLATIHNETTFSIWDVEKRQEVQNWFIRNSPARAGAISPDSIDLATGHSDGDVYVWPLENRKQTKLTGHTAPIHCLAFSPDGRMLASGGEDKKIILWK